MYNEPSPAPPESPSSFLHAPDPVPDAALDSIRPPTPQEFFIDLPLYEVVRFEINQLKEYRAIRYFSDTFDTFGPHCNQHSIFRNPSGPPPTAEYVAWPQSGVFIVTFKCRRIESHTLTFYVLCSHRQMQKIGQYPSLATLNLYDVQNYAGVLEKEKFREFTKAIGLAAHGVGVGSFVYLRRIFETLVEEAHRDAAVQTGWDEVIYTRLRMDEKIQTLKKLLPPFLVQHRSLYGILSKGIHELTEQECLAAFPVVKMGIEIILDGKIQMEAERKKLVEASLAIAKLTALSNPQSAGA